MAEEYKAPRGFHDILGSDLRKFRRITSLVRTLLKRYNYEEIIVPIVEFAKVFERSIGEATDIVQKEMFVFPDRKGRVLALRPEGTAGVVRAYIENKLYALRPYHKFFYEGPMFRYERPQAGRYRQFHQIGAEVFGVAEPHADAELLKLVQDILDGLSIDAVIEINSLGCKLCRPTYREALTRYLHDVSGHLCDVCIDRKDRNPLRVLDCKVETCREAVKEAPKMVDFLCEECREHYTKLKLYLDKLGVKYKENYNLVRGLDYYTRTVFEAVSEKLGVAVVAGGRYDYLVEEFGGPPTPALGFAAGIERLMLLVDEPEKDYELYFVIPFGDVYSYAINVADMLRRKGKVVELSYRGGGLKKQLELANKMDADYAVIIGEDEMREGVVSIKDMKTGEQKKLKVGELM
ncbi:histidyl-tRNA synthetase [Hydrogenivirga caldilitoris]|uniref:Histidine--tRNA ligase n=1 Tax=Hydrogenivirga caldilitoris TaxID=246264 RepID=A0A497XLT2_9AQUI|nr:histidine--tRNA ligase [Hydrogenivirga caldilitoris]RLJ69836.1 histidyl-tRNA synthetase [Hydrogenivirga caldilitoris]